MELIMKAYLLALILLGPVDLHWKIYDELTVNGDAKMKMVKAHELTIHGNLEFQSLDVASKAAIEGSFKGEKGKFGELSIKGSCNADHVKCTNLYVEGSSKISFLDVEQTAEFVGSVEMREGKVSHLILSGNPLILKNVTAETVEVKEGEELTLRGTSAVKGKIHFESKSGRVINEK